MSKADKARHFLMEQVGEEYQMGAEPPHDTDCSGLFYGMLRHVGVSIPRVTAHDYYRRAKRIRRPSRLGDFAVLLSGGHAHHLICYAGRYDTVEARGERWGVIRSTVRDVNRRGAVWMRLTRPHVDLGRLTPPHPRHMYAVVRGERPALDRIIAIAKRWKQTDVGPKHAKSGGLVWACHSRNWIGWRLIRRARKLGLRARPHYTHHKTARLLDGWFRTID